MAETYTVSAFSLFCFSAVSLHNCKILHNIAQFRIATVLIRLYLYLNQQPDCFCCGFNKNCIKGSRKKRIFYGQNEESRVKIIQYFFSYRHYV